MRMPLDVCHWVKSAHILSVDLERFIRAEPALRVPKAPKAPKYLNH